MEQIALTLAAKQTVHPIYVGAQAHASLHEWADLSCKTLILTDDGVPRAHVEAIASQCSNPVIMTVLQGEGAKSFSVFSDVCEMLLSHKFGRKDLLISVGGGVIGDLGGFCAASYMRGIRFINIPTTSLSQIDSSIGGKTAINVHGVKNIVGAFYQPELVIVDPDFLHTLPRRHLNNGLVEAVKAGLIADSALFDLFEQENPYDHLTEIIKRSLHVKQHVVENDPEEKGLRKILNFGHTIGHGVESVYGLSGLLHGEAVAVGMMPMLGSDSLRERVARVFEKIEIDPYKPYDIDQVLEAATRDKKAQGGTVSVIVVNEPGEAIIESISFDRLAQIMREGHQ